MAGSRSDHPSLNQVKPIIRGLLISNPIQTSIQRLCKDFYEFNGYPIPYRPLGFNNVEELLRSIPDTCLVHGNGPMAVILPVVNENVSQINDMVCKQKKPKVPKHASVFKRFGSGTRTFSAFQHPRSVPRSSNSYYERKDKYGSSDYNDTRPKTPNEDNWEITPEIEPRESITPEIDPRQIITPEIEPRQSITPETEPRRSITPEIEPRRSITPEKTAHKKETPESTNAVTSTYSPDTPQGEHTDSVEPGNEKPSHSFSAYGSVTRANDNFDTSFTGVTSPYGLTEREGFSLPGSTLDRNEARSLNNCDNKEAISTETQNREAETPPEKINGESTPLVEQNAETPRSSERHKRHQYKRLLSASRPDGKTGHHSAEHRGRTHHSRKSRREKTNSPKQMKPPPPKLIVNRQKKQPRIASPPPSFNEGYSFKVPLDVQANLKKVMDKFPDGILVTDLPLEYWSIPVSLKYSKSASSKIRPWIAKMRLTDLKRFCGHALKYLSWDLLKKSTRKTSFQPVLFFKAWRVFDYLHPGKMFQQEISYESYRYKSLIDMCADLGNIFQYLRVSESEYVLSDKDKDITSLRESKVVIDALESAKNAIEDYDDEDGAEIVEVDSKNIYCIDYKEDKFPPCVMTKEDRVPRMFIYESEDEGTDVRLGMGEIYDPSKFWVHAMEGELDKLMNDLQKFYSVFQYEFRLPESLISEGLYCISLYADEFHRAIIVDTLPGKPDKFRVLYIDYGTVSTVSSNKLWFMHKKFSKTPHHAIRARLADIVPPIECAPWSLEAILRFHKMSVGQKEFVGKIMRVDDKEKALELYLADVTDKRNIFYINDVLVNERLAMYADQIQERNAYVTYGAKGQTDIHLYPDFHTIEMGLVPTGSDLQYCLKNDLSMDIYRPDLIGGSKDDQIDEAQSKHEEFNRLFFEHKIPKLIINPVQSDVDFSFFGKSLLAGIRKILNNEAYQDSNDEKGSSRPPHHQEKSASSDSKLKSSFPLRRPGYDWSPRPLLLNEPKVDILGGADIDTFFKHSDEKKNSQKSADPKTLPCEDLQHRIDRLTLDQTTETRWEPFEHLMPSWPDSVQLAHSSRPGTASSPYVPGNPHQQYQPSIYPESRHSTYSPGNSYQQYPVPSRPGSRPSPQLVGALFPPPPRLDSGHAAYFQESSYQQFIPLPQSESRPSSTYLTESSYQQYRPAPRSEPANYQQYQPAPRSEPGTSSHLPGAYPSLPWSDPRSSLYLSGTPSPYSHQPDPYTYPAEFYRDYCNRWNRTPSIEAAEYSRKKVNPFMDNCSDDSQPTLLPTNPFFEDIQAVCRDSRPGTPLSHVSKSSNHVSQPPSGQVGAPMSMSYILPYSGCPSMSCIDSSALGRPSDSIYPVQSSVSGMNMSMPDLYYAFESYKYPVYSGLPSPQPQQPAPQSWLPPHCTYTNNAVPNRYPPTRYDNY